ncbi:MAG TPA: hypothetical protein VLT81_09695 [Chondromyces sp.]|nr:hypothetical protein [Chondromyces sp.]
MRLTSGHERILIILIALHSFAVGIMLMFFSEWAVGFAGWAGAEPIFFIWQAGAFHFVLATGYLVEYFRHRTITLLLIAKSMAFVFLLGGSLLAETPWSVWFSGVADGAMALVAYLVHRTVSGRADGS